MNLTIDNVALEHKAISWHLHRPTSQTASAYTFTQNFLVPLMSLEIWKNILQKWPKNDPLSTLSFTPSNIRNWSMGAANKTIINRIEVAQKKVILCIESAHYMAHSLPLFKRLHMLRIPDLHELYTQKNKQTNTPLQ